MKIINSNENQNSNIIFFKDDKGKKTGFSGNVELYNSTVYIDTRDGTGYDDIINKLEHLINNLSLKYHFNGNSFSDTKHDIIVHVLEGIPKYNPNKDMKLSSFIQMRVDRRLINDLRNGSRKCKNATSLNISTFNFTCDCGYNFVATVNKGDNPICPECNVKANNKTKKVPITIFEVNESMLNTNDRESKDNMSVYEMASDNSVKTENDIIHSCDINKWLKNEDPRLIKIIKLIYLQDYSISDAAREAGLTTAGANVKLKDLQKKRIVKEIFGR